MSFGPPTLSDEELAELQESFSFEKREIEFLYERFNFLDKSRFGYLNYGDLMRIPEFGSNPFSRMIVQHIEKGNENTKIDFVIFLDFLELFSARTAASKRISFLFDVLNLNKNGRLCRVVLAAIQEHMRGTLDTAEIDALLGEFDTGDKGYLDFNDFQQFYLSNSRLDVNMTIDFSKIYETAEKSVTIWDLLWPKFKED
ncbi:hypothetical protein ENBRE01_3142 [Enteropsectra breve]|nr:hypothetical protein ENBRE01_3109 [Enteropsectra breve]KAI5153179.1 hypothetical protein ENBRE01_3142 [Enteropsectra breve]